MRFCTVAFVILALTLAVNRDVRAQVIPDPDGCTDVGDPGTPVVEGFVSKGNPPVACPAGSYVRKGQSLNTDERAVETDYMAQVLETYFVRDKAPEAGKPIVVSRPGGEIMLENRRVVNIVEQYPLFEVGGEYVLFMRFDARTRTYSVPYGGQGAFREVGGIAYQVSRYNDQFRNERPSLEFAAEIREAATRR